MVIQIVDLNAQCGGSSVDARPRVGNPTHVVDQASHFGEREALVGLHSATACGHEGDVIHFFLHRFNGATVFSHVLEDVEEKRPHRVGFQQPW